MRMKKIVSLVTITAFSGQTMLLTGCIGNNSMGGASPATNAVRASAKLHVNGSLTDNRLWANITGYDAVSKSSHLDLSIDNHATEDLELVGCDNDSTITNNLESTISALHAAPRTKKFDNKWAAYANSNGSMLDSQHITDNNLFFQGSNTSNRSYSCYYRVFHPEVADFIYIKMTANEVTLATSGATTAGQPDTDIQALANSDVGQGLKNNQLEYSSLSKSLPWASQKDAQMSLVNYTDKIVKSGFQRHLEKVNQELMIASLNPSSGKANILKDDFLWLYMHDKDLLRDELKSMFGLEDGPALEKIVNSTLKFQRIVDGLGTGVDIVEIATKGPKPGIYRLDPSNPNDIERYEADLDVELPKVPNVRNGQDLDKAFIDEVGEEPSSLADMSQEMLPSELEIINVQPIDTLSEYENIQNKTLRQIQQEINSDQPEVQNIAQNLGGDLETAVIERAEMSDNMAIAVGAALIAVPTALGAGLQALMNYLSGTGTNGKGNYKSNMVMLSLDAPSAADAAAWNASHDAAHQIGATTLATPINPGAANGGNTSLSQTMRFTFKNSQNDQQLGNMISLNSISTPWLRGYTTQDPYIGDVSEKSANQTDALINMSVEDLTVASAVKDASNSYNIQRLANLGVSSLGQDLRFDAPVYKVQTIVNTKDNKVIYKAGARDGLFASRNGLVKINDIDGFALNQNQRTTLDVQIPASSLGRLKGLLKTSGPVYGQGFSASLVDDDESGARVYTPVKSDFFLQSNDQNVGGFFFNKFNCGYPTQVGSSCSFTMMIAGQSDNKKHLAKLYLADGNSKTTAVPVYVNYNLVSEPQSALINNGDASPVKILVKNFSGSSYKQVKVSGLPTGAQLLANTDGTPTCNGNLASQQVCELSYDFSQVNSGNYSLVIYGTDGSSSEVPSPDSQNANGFNLTIQGGF